MEIIKEKNRTSKNFYRKLLQPSGNLIRFNMWFKIFLLILSLYDDKGYLIMFKAKILFAHVKLIRRNIDGYSKEGS